ESHDAVSASRGYRLAVGRPGYAEDFVRVGKRVPQLPCLNIPQPYGLVISPTRNQGFALGRPGYSINSLRISVKRRDWLGQFHVPEAHRGVGTTVGQGLAVGRPGQSSQVGTGPVTGDNLEGLSGRGVPQPYRAIRASAGEGLGIWGPRDRINGV